MIEQIIGELSAQGRSFEPYFFRTSDRHELDLVIDFGRELWAVEIKLTSSPSPALMARLDKSAEMVGATNRFLISQVGKTMGDSGRLSCNLPDFLRQILQIGAG